MKNNKNIDEESEYIGNIWGWKMSYISLAVILILFAILGMRYCYLKQNNIPINLQQTEETSKQEMKIDDIRLQ